MKASELRPCELCGGKLGIVFYVATVEQHVVNAKEAGRCAHFEGFMGSLMVARAMHDPDLTEVLNQRRSILCAECAENSPILALAFPREQDTPSAAPASKEPPC